MRKARKLLAVCLALALIMSLFAVLGTLTVSAVGTEASGKRDLDGDGTYWYSDEKVSTYTSGTGTADDPYIVTTAAQLRQLARGNTAGGGKYYKLGNDIAINDTSAEDWYEGDNLKNWIKGSDSTYGTFSDTRNYREMGGELFRDNFDGDGHTVSGLYINYNGTGTMKGAVSSRVYCGWGLFPLVYGATFKNVKLKDVYIKSNVTASNATDQYHGYGALVGIVHGNQPTTIQNVEIENVKFDITKPNLSSAGKPVGVGGIIGYSYGNLTVTDAVVKNVTAKLTNWYATSRCAAYIGAVTGAMGWASTANLTNVLTIGKMNPMSCSSATSGGAVTISSGNYIQDVKANLSAAINCTNCYAIGAEKVFENTATLVSDEATFISDDLDTFYGNIGASENWAEKQEGVLPTLKDFPYIEEHKIPGAVVRCNFSDYTPSVSAKALDNWSIVDEDGNKALKGDFNNTSLAANNFGFIVGSYTYGVHGPLVPGKIYKLEFKAKADKSAAMDYALYNGSTYACSSRDDHVITGGYDTFGRRTANLTAEWQEFSTYFTFESYTNTVDPSQGVNRPYFFVIPKTGVWENAIYFDDIKLTPYSGMSFREDKNHYFEPTLGYDGEDVVLIDAGDRDGRAFEGWYTDPEYNTAFDPDTVKIGDASVLYAKWIECLHENTITVPEASSTCSTRGHDEYTACADCGAIIGEATFYPIDPNYHEGEGTEVKNAKDATCTEAGYTGDTVCKGCGTVIEAGETIDALGHTGGTANCHAKAICETCGEEYGEFDPDNHDGETEIRGETNSTCTEAGYTGDTYCLGCGEKIAEGESKPLADHTLGEWLSDADNHWKECSECHGEIDKGAHTYEWVVTKEATEQEDGLKEEVCSVCGHKSGNTEPIPYVAYTPGDINGDGKVNNKDLTRLFQYLSDWDVEVVEAALDVNGDGKTNNKDLTRLFQYLSDWDVEVVEAALDVNGDGKTNNKDLTRLFQYLSDWEVQIF